MRNVHYYNFYERHLSANELTCFYCGDIGDCLDHVPPISLMSMYINIPRLLVKACNMCNMALGARPLPTLISRQEFLLKKYSKKYKKILRIPDWTDEEVKELSGSLQVYILSKANAKNYALEKLKFMHEVLDNLQGEMAYL